MVVSGLPAWRGVPVSCHLVEALSLLGHKMEISMSGTPILVSIPVKYLIIIIAHNITGSNKREREEEEEWFMMSNAHLMSRHR